MASNLNEKSVLVFQEQQFFSEEEKQLFSELGLIYEETEYEGVPKYLGINSVSTSYYIGASWLSDNKALVVLPKNIDMNDDSIKIDFIDMYIRALKFAPSAEYFSKFYGIDFNSPAIECDELSEQLTPLLIVHFLTILQRLTKKGLKKGYIVREENLKSKIRGKIMMQNNLQKNIFSQRYDKTYCRFQEYTVDIPENRLIKKALSFSINYLKQLQSFSYHQSLSNLHLAIQQIVPFFNQVSDEIEVHEIKLIRKNKLYKDYSEAITLAKQILQRFDYSIESTNTIQKKVPPFWIDMARLYEVYVYSKLDEAYPGQIKFQVPGHSKSAVDFIHIEEGLILDTKYKVRYQNSNRAIMDDVREMSGYARDKKILNHFDKSIRHSVIPCVIVYPVIRNMTLEGDMTDEEINEIQNQNCLFTNFSKDHKLRDLLTPENRIPGFEEFYKLSVELPRR